LNVVDFSAFFLPRHVDRRIVFSLVPPSQVYDVERPPVFTTHVGSDAEGCAVRLRLL